MTIMIGDIPELDNVLVNIQEQLGKLEARLELAEEVLEVLKKAPGLQGLNLPETH